MSLESVELVMAIEEEFRIDITDAEAEKMATPRMLIDFLWQKHQSGLLFAKPKAPGFLTRLGLKKAEQELPGETVASRETLAKKVREIITAVSGVESFDDDDRFVEDLNFG